MRILERITIKTMKDEKKIELENFVDEKNALLDTENLASRLHQVYDKELLRQGKKSKHDRFFSKLPKDIADLDRALANYVIGFVVPNVVDSEFQKLKDEVEGFKQKTLKYPMVLPHITKENEKYWNLGHEKALDDVLALIERRIK